MYQQKYIRRPSSVSSILSFLSSHSDHEQDSYNEKTSMVSETSKRPLLSLKSRQSSEMNPAYDSAFTRSRQSSTCSDRSCEGMSPDETRDLWICMLELQEKYACYHSTRIDLAMDAGDEAVSLMPTRFIIDTLNESVHDLPDEGWEMLEKHLRHDSHVETAEALSKHHFWKRA